MTKNAFHYGNPDNYRLSIEYEHEYRFAGYEHEYEYEHEHEHVAQPEQGRPLNAGDCGGLGNE